MEIVFQTEQWVPYPVELVFAFFANPYNLPLLTPKFLKVRVEEAALQAPPPRPLAADPTLRLRSIAAGEGSKFTISACILPLPLINFRVPWEALITEFVWNSYFIDSQVRGPFKAWQHKHSVRSETRNDQAGAPSNGTVVTDHVECVPPLSPLSSGLVKMQMERSFRDRQRKLEVILPKLVASLNRTPMS